MSIAIRTVLLATVVLLLIRPSIGHAEVTPADYVRVLETWNATARAWTHAVPGNDGLAFYGTGRHEHWAVQAQSTAFSAIAILATAPELDEKRAGETREQLRARALAMLRYTLHTHDTGDMPSTTGKKWGYSWISTLALERMSHAVTALKPWLTDDDQQRLRTILLAECDRVLTDYPVVGAIDAATHKNKPESNIWNGAVLYRTALLYPEAPNAAAYREKASSLLLNGISIPSDATSDTLYSGRKLSQWHVGPNYTEQFGLNHHGYLNLGYMEICLSNLSMLHFFCVDNDIPFPAELHHHVDKLWELTKSLTFDDGRLWRIGGDTRMRYCYCQDYALPAWLMITAQLGDPDAAKFEEGWLKLVAREQASNPDGAFLSGRLAKLKDVSPFYYCRLEGDRAGTMSMGAYFHRVLARKPPAAAATTTPLKAWSDEFHGAAMVNGPRRRASWVWKSAQRPNGTVVPSDRSDMVEWQWNLAGLVKGTGCDFHAEPDEGHVVHTFDGGFATCGSYRWIASADPGEGTPPHSEVAQARTAMVALPDDATTVVLQCATTMKPVYLNQVLGLNCNMPNDVFNGGARTYRFGGQDHLIVGAGAAETPVREVLACGETLSVDKRIHVRVLYGDSNVSLFRPGMRNAMMKNPLMSFSGAGASLYCDVISIPAIDQQRFYEANERLYDIGAVIGVDFDAQAKCHTASDSPLKVVELIGADENRYLVAANLSDQPAKASVPLPGGFDSLCGDGATADQDRIQLDLAANDVVVLRLKAVR